MLRVAIFMMSYDIIWYSTVIFLIMNLSRRGTKPWWGFRKCDVGWYTLISPMLSQGRISCCKGFWCFCDIFTSHHMIWIWYHMILDSSWYGVISCDIFTAVCDIIWWSGDPSHPFSKNLFMSFFNENSKIPHVPAKNWSQDF